MDGLRLLILKNIRNWSSQVHERIVEIAQVQGVVAGRRMRMDTTVVETNVHYPTD
jgi:hypothetical protein